MPVDYSKWDALELSDDSDIEVHPNVDKRSFIRAKQNQIHNDRAQRKHEIDTLKYERVINDGLLARIDRLVSCLNRHAASSSTAGAGSAEEEANGSEDGTKKRSTAAGPDELVFQSLIESAGDSSDDQPPPPPPNVHTNVKEQPSYSKMMAALVDQVKKTVDDESKNKPSPTDSGRIAAFATEVGNHKTKVLDLQQQLLTKLAELEKAEGNKITSESIHTGFNSSSVSKTGSVTDPTAAAAAATATGGSKENKSKTKKSTTTATTPELLNPTAAATATGGGTAEPNEEHSSGSEADTEDNPPSSSSSLTTTTNNPDPTLPSPIPSRTVHPTPLGLQFASLPPNNYQQYLSFISAHPSVLAERETDGLLMRAFDLQYARKETEARHAVHQALLLQYCRSLGRDGVALFFKRVTTQGHQARRMFVEDVNGTYARLATRAREMEKEVGEDGVAADGGGEGEGEGEGVEQIQLHAVNPGQRIAIAIPPLLSACTTDEERASRAVFESFSGEMRKALESGELDEVNKVLGAMGVEEAEEVVGRLGEGGLLSMEEGVVDATKEEGREFLRGLEGRETEEREGGKKAVDEVD